MTKKPLGFSKSEPGRRDRSCFVTLDLRQCLGLEDGDSPKDDKDQSSLYCFGEHFEDTVAGDTVLFLPS